MSASKSLRFGKQLKELRIHLCQKSGNSQGVREFIEQHYVPIKQNNPKFPILIRECSGVQPMMWARYDYGKENSVALTNFSSQEVLNAMENLSKTPT